MTDARYREYMQSEEWASLRAMKLHAVGYRCWVARPRNVFLRTDCDGPLQVHHLHYRTFTRESLDDLEVFCARHHVTADLMRKYPLEFNNWVEVDIAVGLTLPWFEERPDYETLRRAILDYWRASLYRF